MINYFKPVKLTCIELIKPFVIEDVKSKINLDGIFDQSRVKHSLPFEILNEVNKELESLGFPKLWYCQSYIRERGTRQCIHIDGIKDTIINAAINLPISGTKNSYHNWFDGNYDITYRKMEDIHFQEVSWNENPVKVSSLEIDQPYLLRVDKPHSVESSPDEERWIFTMRFEGNPTFESLYDKLPDSTV